ncbi:hypothetical protein SALBM135S_09383 [Streptomyces alboniger]
MTMDGRSKAYRFDHPGVAGAGTQACGVVVGCRRSADSWKRIGRQAHRRAGVSAGRRIGGQGNAHATEAATRFYPRNAEFRIRCTLGEC